MKSNNTCVGHNSEHLCQMWLNSVQCFSSRPWKCCKLWPSLATILYFRWTQKVTRTVKDLKMSILITFPYHRFSGSWKKIIEKLTMFPMSPDDHLLTNRKKSLVRSKQTPDPSVQFLVNMQTTDKFNAEQLRIGWPYANANWFQIRYDNYNGFKFDLMIRFQSGIRVTMVS